MIDGRRVLPAARPLLVPEVGRGARRRARPTLRAACRAAIARSPHRRRAGWSCSAPARRPRSAPTVAGARFAGFGVPSRSRSGVGRPGRRSSCRCRSTVGAWLLRDALGPHGASRSRRAGRPAPAPRSARTTRRRRAARRRRRQRAPHREGARLPRRPRPPASTTRSRAALRAGDADAAAPRSTRSSAPSCSPPACRPGAPPAPLLDRGAYARRAALRRRPVRRRLLRGAVDCERRLTPRRRGRRADRDRQVRPRGRAGPAARRRDRQRRLDAALRRHGHRHGQAAARPSAAASPHHLLDVWPLEQVGRGRRVPAAGPRGASPRSHGRGRLPILVGGSGLYLRGALDRLEFPGESPEIRARLVRRAGRASGPAALHARLAELDPAAAAAILPSNGRRIVRALEVIELTGAPVHRPDARLRLGLRHACSSASTAPTSTSGSTLRVHRDDGRRASSTRSAACCPPACATARPPARRSATRSCSPCSTTTARLDRRPRPRPSTQTVRGTRRFVRRQRSWFRRDPRIALARRARDSGPARPAALRYPGAHAAGEGARHRERLRACCPTSTARSSSRPSWSARCATGTPASAPTACCGSCGRENDPEAKEFAADAEYFMDYRNADGSIAEMCGNGMRVFLRYLQRGRPR